MAGCYLSDTASGSPPYSPLMIPAIRYVTCRLSHVGLRNCLLSAGAWCVLSGLALGCRSAPDTPAPPPSKVALDRSRELVARSTERAFEISDSRDTYTVSVRFNPARCQSPSFEMFAHGQWTRVHLEPTDSNVEEELEAFRRRASASRGFERVEITGRPDGRRRTESGLSFPVLSVRTLLNR